MLQICLVTDVDMPDSGQAHQKLLSHWSMIIKYYANGSLYTIKYFVFVWQLSLNTFVHCTLFIKYKAYP